MSLSLVLFFLLDGWPKNMSERVFSHDLTKPIIWSVDRCVSVCAKIFSPSLASLGANVNADQHHGDDDEGEEEKEGGEVELLVLGK